MVEQVRAAGAEPVLLTYPSESGVYYAANLVIRAAAAALGTRMIDTAAVVSAACPDESCPELLLPDRHATARGNELVADIVLTNLAAEPPGR
jgi:hypothetical protein